MSSSTLRHDAPPQSDPIRRFEAIMARLRAPDGCPWDLEQTPESLRRYVMEEAFEVVEAIDSGRPEALREELGDLLLQIVFLSQIARERGWFTLDDVASGIASKMERRHPHVFGGPEHALSDERPGADQVRTNWEAIKAKEGRRLLAGIPRALPALIRSLRITEKAATVGFDWDNADQVLDKVEEELSELRSASAEGDKALEEAELGDLLFALANWGRHRGLDPEAALRGTVDRFTARFGFVEDSLLGSGRTLDGATLHEMEALWQRAKAQGVGVAQPSRAEKGD